jgi:hypothetical protein
MKQACEAPVQRADDHQTGCDYIKAFHSAKFFLSFVSGSMRQPPFDLKEKVFYCEAHGRDVFPLRKKCCRKQQSHENDLEHGD